MRPGMFLSFIFLSFVFSLFLFNIPGILGIPGYCRLEAEPAEKPNPTRETDRLLDYGPDEPNPLSEPADDWPNPDRLGADDLTNPDRLGADDPPSRRGLTSGRPQQEDAKGLVTSPPERNLIGSSGRPRSVIGGLWNKCRPSGLSGEEGIGE